MDAAVSWLIDPPEQPFESMYRISPNESMIFSFIIIVVSVMATRFELYSESVMLLMATRKPRESALLSVQVDSDRNWRRGWPELAPNEYTTLPFQPAWGAYGCQPVFGSSLVGSNSTAMS